MQAIYAGWASFMGARIARAAAEADYFVFAERNQRKLPEMPATARAVHAYFLLHSFFNFTKMPEERYIIQPQLAGV